MAGRQLIPRPGALDLGSLSERPHDSPGGTGWLEAWLFDVVQPEQSGSALAASFEFLRWPDTRRAAFHASVLRPGYGLLSLVESDAVAPPAPSLEVRSSGLWVDVGVQTAFEHVTVDVEAFAVELDAADDVFRGAFGIRTALGCELEWETAGPVVSGPSSMSYEVPCIVHGELLVGDVAIEIDGWGWRSHRWGIPSSTGDRAVVRGRRKSGDWFSQTSPLRFATVVHRAPVPDPATGARLQQDLQQNANGDMAWCRYLGQAELEG